MAFSYDQKSAWYLPCPSCGAPLTERDPARWVYRCASNTCDLEVTEEFLVHVGDVREIAAMGNRWRNLLSKPLPLVELTCPVRGIKKMHIEHHLALLEKDSTVELVPEPENPHDPYAIRVMHPSGVLFGYLPKDVACRMNASEWNASVHEVLTYDGQSKGLRLRLVPDKEPPWQTPLSNS